jgi:hypothetical protein
MKIERVSMFTGKTNTMEIPLEGHQKAYLGWVRGVGLIQNMLPHLTPDQREFLMTGVTPAEWDEAFGPKEVHQPESYEEPPESRYDFSKQGFYIEGTGGGCTAWRKDYGDQCMLISDDLSHIIENTLEIGVYDADADDEARFFVQIDLNKDRNDS